MPQDFYAGLVFFALGLIQIGIVARSRAEPYLALIGVAMCELALIPVVGNLVPHGVPRTAVEVFFGLALIHTNYLIWRAWRRSQPPARPQGD